MSLPEILEAIGIKASIVMAGLSGGLLRALSRKRYSAREMIASPICGALAAAYLTTPVLHFLHAINWPLPDDADATMHATAFIVGASAMWISDVIIEVIARWVRGGRMPG